MLVCFFVQLYDTTIIVLWTTLFPEKMVVLTKWSLWVSKKIGDLVSKIFSTGVLCGSNL